jgi:hypothetical protein
MGILVGMRQPNCPSKLKNHAGRGLVQVRRCLCDDTTRKYRLVEPAFSSFTVRPGFNYMELYYLS